MEMRAVDTNREIKGCNISWIRYMCLLLHFCSFPSLFTITITLYWAKPKCNQAKSHKMEVQKSKTCWILAIIKSI